MKKPFSLKFVNFFIIAKLFFFSLYILLLITLVYIHPIEGFWYNFKLGVLDAITGDSDIVLTDSEIAEAIGEMIGSILIPTILVILNILFIRKFMYKMTVTMLVIQVFFAFSNNIFSVLLSVILLFIVLFNKNTKNYIKQRNAIESDPIALENPPY
ncbi:hypothetical protein EHS13_29620 [Paenibacillus psychroresistens]|uniref:Uncharacterized protein n=1 Tax=Paenibacillus psychroresistens TaxID=1778678 RepID=A0A6B8RTF7_9BACL|nr:hypothetical protein [Paenibacillus psychroresistens]QGQ98743.1 hypothetical protein EHS13_29620 [Paenibacillus psychroresistens]